VAGTWLVARKGKNAMEKDIAGSNHASHLILGSGMTGPCAARGLRIIYARSIFRNGEFTAHHRILEHGYPAFIRKARNHASQDDSADRKGRWPSAVPSVDCC
jgi:hypothetical protein